MSEFGLKIKNIEASTLFEYNSGVRNHFEYKAAMLTNSLFFDFLMANGLKTYKETTTRDIICLTFNYGTRSYEEEICRLDNLLEKYKKLSLEDSIKKIENLKLETEHNKDKYIKLSKEEIRNEFYKNGCLVNYVTKNKKGEIKKVESIHYKMLYRSTGKAKKGSCMFIRDKLYFKAQNFLYMGIKLPKENAAVVEISAYAPLVSSTIIDKIKINPKNILILKDVDSYFYTNVVSVETNDKKQCVAKTIENYKLKNTLFDGEALLDSSLFPDWANGYILLRHHFCKMAAFNTNIQKFYQDMFGADYLTTKVVDMFGNEHYVRDIQLITTNNAMKWLKFDVSYDYWCQKVSENNNMFGIVKTAHKSKLGDVQRMSYQMVNSLSVPMMENVCKKSLEYIKQLKTNDDVFLQYLNDNKNFANDYEVLIALVKQNKDFLRSDYFRGRKERIIRNYVLNFRSGHVVQNGDNLTMCGNPYELLEYSTGKEILASIIFKQEKKAIQCYTPRFADGEYLAAFRSPHNSFNNILSLHNVYNSLLQKYFNFSDGIIAVNCINTDIQDRANGCDFDSDSIYTTNQTDIVRHAQYCYLNYLTIVNNIPKKKKKYNNIIENYSLIDNNLAQAQLAIGESSNLAQIALSYSFNFKEQKYIDYVCILSVLAQVAIDSAKRQFDVDIMSEIKRIRKDLSLKNNKYPYFWRIVQKSFYGEINKNLICPMNYLAEIKIKEYRNKKNTLPMNYFFVHYDLEKDKKQCKKVEQIIQKYSLELYRSDYQVDGEQFILMREDFDMMIKDLQQVYLSKNYLGLMSWLINRAFVITNQMQINGYQNKTQLNFNKTILLKTLYKNNPQNLLKIFSKNAENV